ncbi:MAG TPA: hypothetical protein VH475_16460 [Tepidisphaeraceae bacterium]|jgi:hypothetical protein
MKGLRTFALAGALIVTILAGCQTPMRTVISLDSDNAKADAQPQVQTINATEKGTYYLYSSKEQKPIYQTDLKKGEPVGFETHGDRARGIAKGIRIELSDYSEGASYSWKIEEKKKE